MSYLLDTNHCIYLINGWRKDVSKQSELEKKTVSAYSNHKNEMVFMAEATLGELIYGAEYSQKRTENLKSIETLKKAVVPLAIDQETWKIFGETKASLRKQGKVMPEMDILIACTAKRYGLIIVTHDKHMELLPESFRYENWTL